MPDLKWNRAFALEQAAGDEELLQELLEIFKEASANDLVKLNQGLTDNDAAQVRSAVHSIKGAAASLGLEAIRELTLAMETSSLEGALAPVRDSVSVLEALLIEVQKL